MEAADYDQCCVPPGFRFHPTEEELVGYYLARKVASQKIDLDIIREVDLYGIEPWDLQALLQQGRGGDQQCFFFSYKDRKYPSGTRTNRATAAGFWKATGRDKPVLSSRFSFSGGGGAGEGIIGMRKTLVFYKGRAPNGRKTDWIIHEYRLLLGLSQHQQQEEAGCWVVCRAFQKPVPNLSLNPTGAFVLGSSTLLSSQLPPLLPYHPPPRTHDEPPTPREEEEDSLFQSSSNNKQQAKHNNNLLFMTIPQLIDVDSPTGSTAAIHNNEMIHDAAGSSIDWNFLDTLLSSSSTDPSSFFAAPPY